MRVTFQEKRGGPRGVGDSESQQPVRIDETGGRTFDHSPVESDIFSRSLEFRRDVQNERNKVVGRMEVGGSRYSRRRTGSAGDRNAHAARLDQVTTAAVAGIDRRVRQVQPPVEKTETE